MALMENYDLLCLHHRGRYDVLSLRPTDETERRSALVVELDVGSCYCNGEPYLQSRSLLLGEIHRPGTSPRVRFTKYFLAFLMHDALVPDEILRKYMNDTVYHKWFRLAIQMRQLCWEDRGFELDTLLAELDGAANPSVKRRRADSQELGNEAGECSYMSTGAVEDEPTVNNEATCKVYFGAEASSNVEADGAGPSAAVDAHEAGPSNAVDFHQAGPSNAAETNSASRADSGFGDMVVSSSGDLEQAMSCTSDPSSDPSSTKMECDTININTRMSGRELHTDLWNLLIEFMMFGIRVAEARNHEEVTLMEMTHASPLSTANDQEYRVEPGRGVKRPHNDEDWLFDSD